MKAEATVLFEGLQLCLALGCSHVVVEMDSLVLLNIVKGLQSWPWRIDAEVMRIQNLLNKAVFTLTHCYREINIAADDLERQAAQTRRAGTFTLFSLPSRIRAFEF